ncbi:MAG: helix-turn-helix domain-containing protein [Bdellovibrionota bacterium]
MKITGELLKSERIKKDLSIQDVAYALKLSSRIIQAIENGDTDELPAKTFVRGFVKSYADYLKINSDAVLKQFQEEMGSTHPVPKTIASPIGQTTETSAPTQKSSKVAFRQNVESISGNKMEGGLTQKNVIYFAVVTSLVIVIAIINKVANHYQNEIPQISDASADGVPVNTEAVVASSPSVVSAETVPNDIVSALSSSSTLTGGVEIASAAISTKAAVAVSAVSANTTANHQPQNTAATEKSKGQAVEVLIEAKKDAYIDYAKGNTTDFKRLTLKANTYQILKSQAGLHLRAADGSAVSITVNGVSKGQMSNANKFVEMTF